MTSDHRIDKRARYHGDGLAKQTGVYMYGLHTTFEAAQARHDAAVPPGESFDDLIERDRITAQVYADDDKMRELIEQDYSNRERSEILDELIELKLALSDCYRPLHDLAICCPAEDMAKAMHDQEQAMQRLRHAASHAYDEIQQVVESEVSYQLVQGERTC